MNLNAITLYERLRRHTARERRDVTDQRSLGAHLDAHRTDGGIDRGSCSDGWQDVDDVNFPGVGRAIPHGYSAKREDTGPFMLAGDQHGEVRADLI